MSENTSAIGLTSQYTAQVTADLENNAKEQQRISGEIAALQEQLAALERDHTMLVGIQQAIGTAPVSAEIAAPSNAESVTVPTPRKETPSASGAGKRPRTKKTAAVPRRAAAKKPAAEKRAPRAETTSAAQPTLVELVRRHLADQSEPRSAAEIATALGQVHPERNVKTTVVRTTLEGLVARNQAQRTKQGTSVFYTAPDGPEQAAPAQTEEQPAQADA
ncbi:hypothetical protein [Streptomyces sp. MMG1533]|uniref:hypothetical protein n=1 Tax=Streptomyces sp. MMG1533 TaxID=1415546 RepID=UPI0006AEAAF4|nr:hypothetical protein [Streptomyces sp. MMG1533]